MRKLIVCANVAVMLALATGVNQARASTVSETVTFSSGPNLSINSSFIGLSYEKAQMTVTGYFSATNTSLINLFNLIGPGVVRIGAGTVDTYNWNGVGNCPAITSNEVNSLAGFITNCPQWTVIYGINFASNTEANATAEATYVHTELGSQLLGFEIGNEPDEYGVGKNHLRPAGFTYDDYITEWNPLKLGVEGQGHVIDPATADSTNWFEDFVAEETGIISMGTQHYYRGTPSNFTNNLTAGMELLLTNNPTLPATVDALVAAVNSASLSDGFRMDESGSFVGGGLLGVSDVYGAAMWTLDYMFMLAANGAQGVNFHGGGESPYTPLYSPDNHPSLVTAVRPEYYGLAMFSLIPPGKVITANLSTFEPYYNAYGVTNGTGGMSVLLNDKDTAKTFATTVNLGANVSSALLYEMSGTGWFETNGYTVAGAQIETNGTWAGNAQSIVYTSGGQVTVDVPPYNAWLLNPVTKGTKPLAVLPGANWDLRATMTDGDADYTYQYGGSTVTNFFMGDWLGYGHTGPGDAIVNSSGQWEFQLRTNNNSGGANYDFTFCTYQPGDILVVGDWNGAGPWTPGIVRTNSTGQLQWLLATANLTSGNATTNYNFTYGLIGDTPVVGDWDGNGTFTPGVVKAGSNVWLLRNENSTGTNDVPLFGYGGGPPDNVPIVGDWDGNGTWTCGVIHGGNEWELRNSNNDGGADIVFGYGGGTDTFLVWY